MKKFLSAILAFAMVLSCFAGTTFFVLAEQEERLNLNTEYAWSYPGYWYITGDDEGKTLTDGNLNSAAVFPIQNEKYEFNSGEAAGKHYTLFGEGKDPHFYVQNDFGFVSKVNRVELAFNTENGAVLPKSIDIFVSNDGYNYYIYPAQTLSKETKDGVTIYTAAFNEEVLAIGVKAYIYAELDKNVSICELSVIGIKNENERILVSQGATYEWTGGNDLAGYGTDDGTLLTDGVVESMNESAKFIGKTATKTDDLTKSKVSEILIDLGEVKNVSEVQLQSLLTTTLSTLPSYIVARYSVDGVTYEDLGQSYEIGKWGSHYVGFGEFAVMRNHTVKARYIKVLIRGTALLSEVQVFGSEKPIEEMDYDFEEKKEIASDTNISHKGTITVNGTINMALNDQDLTKTYKDLTKSKKNEIILDFDEKENNIYEIMLDFQRSSTRFLPKSIKGFISYDGETYEEVTSEFSLHAVGEKGIYRQYLDISGVKKVKLVVETSSKEARITELCVYADQPQLPLYRGGFFQMTMPRSTYETAVVKNSEYMWYLQLKGMKELGMEYVVMQYGADFNTKKTACNAPRLFAKGYTLGNGYGCEDPYTTILEVAQKLGMKVFLGSIFTHGSYNDIMNAGGFTHTAQVAADGVELVKDMYENYGHYESFAGYYFSDETCDSWMMLDEGIDLYRSIYIPMTRTVRELDPERKIMISPAIWRGTGETAAERLLYNLVKPEVTGERPIVDIVAAQDCLGRINASNGNEDFSVADAVYKSYESCIQGWKKALKKQGQNSGSMPRFLTVAVNQKNISITLTVWKSEVNLQTI